MVRHAAQTGRTGKDCALDQKQVDNMLAETLEDQRLSRAERKGLRAFFQEHGLSDNDRAFVRNRAFAMARISLATAEAANTLEWLEDVLKAVEQREQAERADTGGDFAKVCFSPGKDCLNTIVGLFQNARHAADVCVFTITDDRIADAIAFAHRRGVKVRIISDNDKMWDRGSDVKDLARSGVRVVTDRTDAHMHHKFAVFDDRLLLTGSYNWTRSAANKNDENVLVTDDSRLVQPFLKQFNTLWKNLG
jgi:cardiolipin hydrolase